MGCLGNVIWFLFGGLWQGLSWTISGILWCITIIGIPIGRQCFKFASLAFFPFGKEIQYGGGAMSTLANILILSRLVDTFFSRISLTMQPPPKPHSTACVLPWEEGRHWQSRSSGCSSS